MNWKKLKDEREDNIVVEIPYKEYKKLEPKVELADKINSLNGPAKEVVYALLEKFLEDQEDKNEEN